MGERHTLQAFVDDYEGFRLSNLEGLYRQTHGIFSKPYRMSDNRNLRGAVRKREETQEHSQPVQGDLHQDW